MKEEISYLQKRRLERKKQKEFIAQMESSLDKKSFDGNTSSFIPYAARDRNEDFVVEENNYDYQQKQSFQSRLPSVSLPLYSSIGRPIERIPEFDPYIGDVQRRREALVDKSREAFHNKYYGEKERSLPVVIFTVLKKMIMRKLK